MEERTLGIEDMREEVGIPVKENDKYKKVKMSN